MTTVKNPLRVRLEGCESKKPSSVTLPRGKTQGKKVKVSNSKSILTGQSFNFLAMKIPSDNLRRHASH